MYSVGQIITKEQHIDFANWCAVNHPKLMTEPVGDGTYRIIEIPIVPEPVPTRSQMHELRKQAYAETTDRMTLEKMRLQAIGQWNQDRELEYQAKMAELSEEIKAKYPFSHKETPSAPEASDGEENQTEPDFNNQILDGSSEL